MLPNREGAFLPGLLHDSRETSTDPRGNETEQELADMRRIAAVANLDELPDVLRSISVVRTDALGNPSGDSVARRVDQVRHGQREINFVTRALGIADKVQELLSKDSHYKKHLRRIAKKKR